MAHRCPCGLPDVVETAPRLDVETGRRFVEHDELGIAHKGKRERQAA